MALSNIVILIFGTLGVTLPQFILLITALGAVIFIAVELRFGLMMLFFMFAVELIAFWSYGVAYIDLILSVMCLLATFVCMTLSLLLVRSGQQHPGGLI